MKKIIPTYSLNNLTTNKNDSLEVFFLDKRIDKPQSSVNIPFRSNYYGVGICLSGEAELIANLETYYVHKNSVVTMSPHIIKQWTYMSKDFKTLTIFFTENFIKSNKNSINLDKFQFFESVANHVFQVSKKQSELLIEQLKFLKSKYETEHLYRNEILKNLINVLLYEVSFMYNQLKSVTVIQNRSQILTSEFKKLVNNHFYNERSVSFYADKLFVTSKHLSETIKELTGKTAGDWIKETVILEAKILLQNPSLSISQISNILHFTDQSIFGRYFKTSTGHSPASYRNSI